VPRPAAVRAGKWKNLALLSVACLFAMTLWFSGSAVLPQLTDEWSLDDGQRSWVTMSVQIGFVAGALVSALLNLADRLPLVGLFAASSLLGALANGAVTLVPEPSGALVFRFLTGFALAGVYPPGMKIVATWCREDRGLGIGLLVGAIVVGSATPHLLNALPALGAAGMPPWRVVVWSSSALAAAGAVLAAGLVRPGPHLAGRAPFDWRFAGRAFSHAPTRLANFGYLGHMWELYAMWTWVPLLLLASYDRAGWSPAAARVAGFATIGVGCLGSILAGALADRYGRPLVAGSSLALSGVCCLAVGFSFGSPVWLTAVCLVWGFAVVADSAQFSAAISEFTDSRYVGTALTVQTSLGFLLTLASIRLLPWGLAEFGWQRCFVLLILGPIFGLWAMIRLSRFARPKFAS